MVGARVAGAMAQVVQVMAVEAAVARALVRVTAVVERDAAEKGKRVVEAVETAREAAMAKGAVAAVETEAVRDSVSREAGWVDMAPTAGTCNGDRSQRSRCRRRSDR